MKILLILIFLCSTANAALTPNKLPKTKTGGSSPTLQDSVIYDNGTNVGIGTSNPQGALVVTNGNVGIGTWKPGYGLETIGDVKIGSAVSGATYGNLYMGGYGSLIYSNSGSTSFTLQNAGTNGSLVLTTGTTGFITFNRSTAESARIDVNGNVGIGTTAPVSKLAVVGGVGIGTGVNSSYVSTAAPAGGMIVEGNVGIGTIAPVAELEVTQTDALDAFRVNDQATDTTPFIINSTGNVGIGTATPQGALVVTNGNVGIGTWAPGAAMDIIGYLRIQGVGNELYFTSLGGGSNYGRIYASASGLFIQNMAASGSIIFGNTSTAERMRIDSSGNVGIGTTTPQGKLIVTSGNVGIGTWTAAGGNLIVNGGGNVGINTAWPGQALDVAGGIRLAGNLSGGTTGNVGIGTYGASAETCDSVCNSTNSRRCFHGVTSGGIPTSCEVSITGTCLCLSQS